MKIALVGGGGFRTPMVYDILRRAPFTGSIDELVLHDVDEDRLSRIAAVIEGLYREGRGARLSVRATTSARGAIEDASFVLCAIRVGGLEARAIDERVPLDLGVLGQETTGPAGIAFALRTLPLMLDVARTVAEAAPEAWFLNFTNPAGLVTEAVRDVLGDRAIGICDSPASLCGRVAAALGQRATDLRFDYVGLNHFGWLNRVQTADGEDLLQELLTDDRRLAAIDEARLLGIDRVREVGAIPNEYVVYHERAAAIARTLRRRSRAETLLEQQALFYEAAPVGPTDALAAWRTVRDLRHGSSLAEGWSTSEDTDADAAAEGGSSEEGYAAVAAEVMESLLREGVRPPTIVNVANRGALPWLDDSAVIEVPCRIGADGIGPVRPGPVPDEQRAAIARMKEMERTTIRAGLERSADLALAAIALHPLVPTREVAEQIWAGYRERHAWLRETFR